MKFDKPKVAEFEILSMKEFKEKKKDPTLPTPTIHYAIDRDQLDYVQIGTQKFIIWNEKAICYKPDGGGRKRNLSGLQL